MKKKRRLIPSALLLVLVTAFLLYVSDYYRATDTALAALEPDRVLTEKTDYGWYFDGPSTDSALIFYPGGKVEETAYAPLLHKLADSGIDVCLVRMPFHLAFFSMNAADGIMDQYEYERWYIGGHSLGGVAAASYAASHSLDGVILFAAYPVRPFDEPMLILYGSEDGVLNLDRVAAAGQYGTVEEVEIKGGNHAGFGDYGDQAGDHPAGISAEEQQREAVEAIVSWLS